MGFTPVTSEENSSSNVSLATCLSSKVVLQRQGFSTDNENIMYNVIEAIPSHRFSFRSYYRPLGCYSCLIA